MVEAGVLSEKDEAEESGRGAVLRGCPALAVGGPACPRRVSGPLSISRRQPSDSREPPETARAAQSEPRGTEPGPEAPFHL